MNIISFDTEEWFIENQKFPLSKERKMVFDKTLENILSILDENKLIATFFCVGGLAKDFPSVVKHIAENGHEIGCHSNIHTWLNKMSDEDVEEDTKMAIHSLEDVVGCKVKSYRAPAFSITEKNRHHLEILTKYGIENDCSIFPTARDFGGFKGFPESQPCTILLEDGKTIHEFPISPITFMGKDLVFSGGGYFRLVPYFLMKNFIDRHDYNMFYFHITDLLNEKTRMLSRKEYEDYFKEPGTLKNRVIRNFKTNVGRKSAWNKLMKLLSTYDFMNVEQAASCIDWKEAPLVTI